MWCIIWFLCVVAVLGSPQDGTRNRKLVVGGSVVNPKSLSAPFFVSLQRFRTSKQRWEPFCGASLIQERWIITAGHCFKFGRIFPNVRAVIGAYDISSDSNTRGQVIKMDIVFHPPEFKGTTNDLALVRLKTSVNVKKYPPILVLDRLGEFERPGTMLTVVGFGHIQYGGNHDFITDRRQVKVPVQSLKECQQQDAWKYEEIDERNLCAGYISGGKDSCDGDSGGPLFHYDERNNQYTLVGVVSRGKNCGAKDSFGVYSRISHAKFLKWIKEIVDPNFTKRPTHLPVAPSNNDIIPTPFPSVRNALTVTQPTAFPTISPPTSFPTLSHSTHYPTRFPAP